MSAQDLYTAVHKACRSMLYGMGSRLQMNDFTDETATRDLLSHLRYHLEMFNGHAQDEEGFIHSKMREFEPELVDTLEGNHVEIERRGDVIKSIAMEIEGLHDPDEMIAAGRKLHQALNDYIAFFITHINFEEETSQPTLWRHFDDQQLIAMRANIIANHTPEQNIFWLGGIFSSSDVNELAALVSEMKFSPMPPEAIQAIMDLARDKAGEERWQVIQRRANQEIMS
jgi:Hemerythrin HHE cation binding domain